MKIILTADQLREGVDRLAGEIEDTYGDLPLTIVGVLTGSIVLLADLIRRLKMPLRIGLVQASSYRQAAEPGTLSLSVDMLPNIASAHVLLVDDIFDTGNTLIALMGKIGKQNPASLRSAVLLRKHGRKAVPIEPDFVGFEIPNVFVVGYGLDYQDGHRNLPYVAGLEDSEINSEKV